MKKITYILTVILLIALVSSCKKDNTTSEDIDPEKQFDIRGQWELKEAYIYYDLNNTYGGISKRKKDHFRYGNQSILIDGSGKKYPYEFITKGDIWEFTNLLHYELLIHKFGTTAIDTVAINNYARVFDYYYGASDQAALHDGPTTCVGNEDECTFYYHVVGSFNDSHRGIEVVIHSSTEISLILTERSGTYYEDNGQYESGTSFNELKFVKVN